MTTNIMLVAGTRPEIIKLTKLAKDLQILGSKFLYTGQHFSKNMKQIFLSEFGIKCDYDLNCNTSNVDTIYNETLKLFKQTHPQLVMVYGDTNSSLAVAFAAKEIKAKLIHIEAGLRCFDSTVPEEKNRIAIDSWPAKSVKPSSIQAYNDSFDASTP